MAVVGSGGAGKTRFAARLGDLTGLPVIHLDHLHWKPGWVETPREEWAAIVAAQAAGDRWIIDGNFAGTLETRFARADTVIVLALSRWRCTARALRRVIVNHGRETQAPGCPERFDASFLRWIWRYPTDGRRHVDAALERLDRTVAVVELRTPRAVRRYLSRRTPGGAAPPTRSDPPPATPVA